MHTPKVKVEQHSKTDDSSSLIQEYDEILNKYHQKTKAKVTKKRLHELIIVCNNKLAQGEVVGFTRNLEDCLTVSEALHSDNSPVVLND
jgi:hypothetical protein